MAKTSIDGLRVREPDYRHRRADRARSNNAHTVDLTTRHTGSTAPKSNVTKAQRAKRQEALDSVEQIRKRQAAASAFLDPVQSFDFDSEPVNQPDNEFTASAEADWSDLLNDFQGNSDPLVRQSRPKTRPQQNYTEEDLFDSWTNDTKSGADSLADALDEVDDDTPISEPLPKKQRKHHKKHHLVRNLMVGLACLLVIGGGILYKWGDDLISRLTGGNSGLWDAITSFVSDEIPFETDQNGRTNVLIFGTEGYNMNGNTAHGEHDGAQLTDSIMVASIDQKTKDVALISLPRDLKVPKACSVGKINEVFWCHNQDGTKEAAGAQALMDQVGSVLGLDFQYYAHINWASLIDIIDTIGGITVTLDEDINDYGWTNAVAQAGVPMNVNGEQALGLARARHGTTGGDFTRGNTQQKIVEGIIHKLLDNGIGVTEALNLLNILGDNLRSNFSTDNIKAGVRLLSGFNVSKIRQIPLVDYNTNTFYVTTATINEVSFVVPSAGNTNYKQIQEYVASMLNDSPAAREQARIIVYNASGQYGVAGAERTRLQNDDYNVVDVGDAEIGSCREKYCLYAIKEDFPATRAALEERYQTKALGAADLPSDIVAGEVDFILILGFSEDAA